MPQTSTRAPDARSIRLIHLSLPLGVLVFLLVALFARREAAAAASPALASVTLLLGIAALIAAQVLRGRIPARSASEPLAAWWQRRLTQAIVVWSLVEAGALLGVVGYWVTGRSLPLAATAAAFILFVRTAPGQLAGDS